MDAEARHTNRLMLQERRVQCIGYRVCMAGGVGQRERER